MQVSAFVASEHVDIGKQHVVGVVHHIAAPAAAGMGLVHGRRLRSQDRPTVRFGAVRKGQGNWYRHQLRLEQLKSLVHPWRQEETCWRKGSHFLEEEVIAVGQVMETKEGR